MLTPFKSLTADSPSMHNSVEMTFNYYHVTKSKVSWQPHPKIRVLHLGETFVHLRHEKKENVARFASTEDDFTNCTTHGSMKKTNLVV